MVETIVVVFASDSDVVFMVVCLSGVVIILIVVKPSVVVNESVSVVNVVVFPEGVETVFVVVLTFIGCVVVFGSNFSVVVLIKSVFVVVTV